jgi:hypothetical protein
MPWISQEKPFFHACWRAVDKINSKWYNKYTENAGESYGE